MHLSDLKSGRTPPPTHKRCQTSAHSPCALDRKMVRGVESCTKSLLELWLHRRWLVPWTPQPQGQRLWWVGEEARRLAQRKGSAQEEFVWRFLKSSSRHIAAFRFLSFPGHIPAAWRFSSWEMFPCPNLCALTLALWKSVCLQGTGCLHVPIWRLKSVEYTDESRKGDDAAVRRKRSD